ncbi:hypothetical protein SEA_ERICMILLARD_146 [Mycobacterium phage EricMillard]|uniref:Uncharacterized protein n=2 Tax=Omegavirus TaxID=1623292 RepID=A0A3S9UAZ5_9CAUD|nr:hypothetical protein CL87_gp135 [Mycobacterium phage Thibault]AEJ94057.1 hypothetical protein THIBAULT_135 [Mycobacterium phage Thibault]AXQ52377.1 hypothetical protein SEA_ERICMILLARD_146 [Mycobacterium phage EricMillard]AZS07487.1 hypothetical protein PBI_DUKE13_150 [Mycobacterium phage Duke13]
MIPHIGSRRWIAWKLVQLAARIYDAEYYERIHVTDALGREIFEAVIVGDSYGCGISSATAPAGRSARLPDGSTIHWDDDYKPDWL